MNEIGHEQVAERVLAGLVVGTSWWDTDRGREIQVKSARKASENGLEFVELHLVRGGDIPADTFLMQVKRGKFEPYSPNSDDAIEFVSQYVDTGGERDE